MAELAEDDDQAYLEQVRREIDEEVRRRRAAGDFPPSFERKLDELFARFTPTGTHDDHFTDALKLADRAAYFDAQVPFGSRRRPQGFTKWVLWQAEAWFVNYVVRQLNHFSSSIMRVVHLLDERLGEVESEVAMLVSPALPEEDAISSAVDLLVFADLLKSKFSTGTLEGRVLHAECGDGSLVESLAAADLDAYGIDPGSTAADIAVRKGLDIRRDDVLGHLASIGDEKLAGLVLSGCVDRMTVTERRQLLRLAELKLAPGATVALIVTSPVSWDRLVGPVVSDLAPGRPWNAETWAYLLSQLGFTQIGATAGPPGEVLDRAEGTDSTAVALNRALDRLEPLLSTPDSSCVLATKKRSGDKTPNAGEKKSPAPAPKKRAAAAKAQGTAGKKQGSATKTQSTANKTQAGGTKTQAADTGGR